MHVSLVVPNNKLNDAHVQDLSHELQYLGLTVSIGSAIDYGADIVFYLSSTLSNYQSANSKVCYEILSNNLLCSSSYDVLNNKNAFFVCYSKKIKDELIKRGISEQRILHISFPVSSYIQRAKIKLGFTHRVYNDTRKRESMLIDICRCINSDLFMFEIMGAGWTEIINEIRSMGFEVLYYPDFDKEKYNSIMKDIDYYCYFGFDEGSMGFMDAIAAGAKTIVTPQGYHLECGFNIDYPVKTIKDIVNVLRSLEEDYHFSLTYRDQKTMSYYATNLVHFWEKKEK